MAERRMFAKSIVLSDAFLDMPATTRCLYFTLSMLADDDGFVNSPRSIMRQSGATDDDMKVLMAKKFVICFDSGVLVIKHWRIHNLIQSDRYHKTKYENEMSQLVLDDTKNYHLLSECKQSVSVQNTNQIQNGYKLDTSCKQDVSDLEPQVSIGKVSIGKDSIGKVSKPYIDITCNDKGEDNDTGLQACSLPKIFRKDGSYFQTTEQYITVKQKAYPSVDVMAEFWKMQAKTETNPTSRPFMQYLDGFVNSWLQNVIKYNAEQNEKEEAKKLMHYNNDEMWRQAAEECRAKYSKGE